MSKLTNREAASLAGKSVLFGHRSVGDDIMRGIRDFMAADARLRLNIVHCADPGPVPAAFIDCHIGENGRPESKDRAFAVAVARAFATRPGIAMYKYCYADIDGSTAVARVFENYARGITALKRQYPGLRIVHVTVPLTTVEPAPKAWLKRALGRDTARAANIKRNQFNELLRKTYAGGDPIFDLAAVESTRPDGTGSCFTDGGKQIYTLAPELTTDGGHLNQAGSRAAAEQLLRVLADIQ